MWIFPGRRSQAASRQGVTNGLVLLMSYELGKLTLNKNSPQKWNNLQKLVKLDEFIFLYCEQDVLEEESFLSLFKQRL